MILFYVYIYIYILNVISHSGINKEIIFSNFIIYYVFIYNNYEY